MPAFISSSFSFNAFQSQRVYATGDDGTLFEWQYEGNNWSGPTPLQAKAALGTPVTSTYYVNPDGVLQVNLYYRDATTSNAGVLHFDGTKWVQLPDLP